MHTTDTTFLALSDATRRSILDRLQRGSAPVNELVERYDMTQPAISQHLRILREAGLVSVEKRGRQRLYSLAADPLRGVFDWVTPYEQFWTDKLTQLGEHLRKPRK